MPTEKIKSQRDIIDRQVVMEKLEQLVEDRGSDATTVSPLVLEIIREAMDQGRSEVKRRFLDERLKGSSAAASISFLTDQIMRLLYDFATTYVFPVINRTSSERLCLVAVGGYGRAKLAPGSDIDILFLLPYKQTPWGEQVVEFMLYILWDLKLKVGHATRSVDECLRRAKADLTIRTSILESRYIWGDQDLAVELRDRFRKELVAGSGASFIDQKLAERDERHQRMGNARYVVEPNLKEGKGGMRDLHTLFWIGKYAYNVETVEELVDKGVFTEQEFQLFMKAEEFLWTVRCHLHYLAGRAEERIGFDVQPEIAARMGIKDTKNQRAPERLMKQYFLVAKDVGDLTRIFCASLEARMGSSAKRSFRKIARRTKKIDAFLTDGIRLNVPNEKVLLDDPVNILRLFHLAQKRDLDIHPDALQLLTRHIGLVDRELRENKEANRLFVEMLTSKKGPHIALTRMNEAGVLGKFIPDFGRVVAQMQHDMYHHYTVDEHTIRAIGILSRIESGALAEEHPLSDEVVHEAISRKVLYASVFLHDIAKGRGGDHAVLGAEVARKLCPRLGFSESETELTAWLVLHHLDMSNTAFRRDVSDPKTVLDFVEKVQSLEQLKLLLLLTVVDIRAVGPGVWNGWKGQLLRDLYQFSEEVLSGGFATKGRAGRIEEAKVALAGYLKDWEPQEISRHIERFYETYWLSTDRETQGYHAELMKDAAANDEPLTVNFRPDAFKAATEMTLHLDDHPGVFARITGALAVCGAVVLDAKIFTTSDGMALDMFWIQDEQGHAFDDPPRLKRLREVIRATLSGDVVPRQTLAGKSPSERRIEAFTVVPRVLIDNGASNVSTVIELSGRDRPGLLYDLARALFDLNISITSAHITTYGARAVDVFYVQDLIGQKITHGGKKKAIERRLTEVLLPEPKAGTEAARLRAASATEASAAAE